ncbi:hypothetical protein E3P99_03327 [Wallemia hederae]|uniref:RCC1/BLIP-II protein n=1 Tax=Wallemia hederae TaxID=1540922 RepID=A0A4T0FI54_9BASI|nr:hypothetical protein E3P99_03327 [Wallemia hederae]
MTYRLLNAGSNSNHQLNECDEDISSFKFAREFNNGVEIATGGNHTLVLSNTHVYGAGSNSSNQLGLGTDTVHTLTRLDWLSQLYPLHTPTRILASWDTSFVLLEGFNQSPLFISIGSAEFGARGVANASATPTPISLPLQDHHIVHLSASFRHIVAILKHNNNETFSVIGWGASRKGQLSDAYKAVPFLATPHTLLTTSTPLIRVSTGREHTIIHSADDLICWGSNAHGQLNIPSVPKHRTLLYGCTWRGTVWYDGEALWSVGRTGASPNATSSDDIRTPQLISDSLPPIQQLAVGSEHTLLRTADNTVYVCGWNEHGNLGLGHTRDMHTPIRIPLTATHIHAGNATSFILTDNVTDDT